MMQWNLSYQRQVGKDWLVTANYLGNASRHIWGSTDINYAIPTAGATTSNTNNRRLTYSAQPYARRSTTAISSRATTAPTPSITGSC